MEKIDKRRKYIAVFDTETAGSLDFPLVYDIGLSICDRHGKIYQKQDWVIKEIFDNKKLMENAYYGKKRPIYENRIEKGETQKVPFKQARKEFNNILKKWGVKVIMAYNLSFDIRALTSTCKFLYRQFMYDESNKFLQIKVDLQDIWGFACETIYQQKGFHYMIKMYKFYTPKKNPLTNAEIGYRYIMGDMEFKERHTALSDTEVEVAILAKCYRTHKKYTKGIINHPWRIVANKHKELGIAS